MGLANPRMMPHLVSFLIQRALYYGFQTRSHLFLNCFGRGKEGEGIVYTSYRASTVLGGPKHMATPVEPLDTWNGMLWEIFLNLKPMEIAKRPCNIICRSIKVMHFCQIIRAWLNIGVCHAHLKFEP